MKKKARKILWPAGPGIVLLTVLAVFCGACRQLKPEQAEKNGQALNQEQAENIGRAFKTAQLDNSDIIWPDNDWSGLAVLLLDSPQKRAYIWNENGRGQIRETVFAELPPKLRQGGSWFVGQMAGRKILGLSAADSRYDSDDILELAFHEGFHMVGQKNWQVRDRVGWRGDDYPEDRQPRYLRRRAMKDLYQAYSAGDSQALGQAVFWHKKYRREFPADYQKSIDIDRIEGSADYAGLMAAALGQLGPEADITEKLRSRLTKRWRLKYNNMNYSGSLKEGESYCLGAIAGLLLDRLGASDWKRRVSRGESQLDILAEMADALPAPDNPDEEKKIKRYYDLKNNELKARLDVYFGDLADSAGAVLALPLDWSAGGTWTRTGFLTYADGDISRKFIVGLSGEFTAPGGGRVIFNGALAEFIVAPYPADPALIGYLAAPVRVNEMKENSDGTFDIDRPDIKAEQAGFTAGPDEDGRSRYWLK